MNELSPLALASRETGTIFFFLSFGFCGCLFCLLSFGWIFSPTTSLLTYWVGYTVAIFDLGPVGPRVIFYSHRAALNFEYRRVYIDFLPPYRFTFDSLMFPRQKDFVIYNRKVFNNDANNRNSFTSVVNVCKPNQGFNIAHNLVATLNHFIVLSKALVNGDATFEFTTPSTR